MVTRKFDRNNEAQMPGAPQSRTRTKSEQNTSGRATRRASPKTAIIAGRPIACSMQAK